MAKLRRAQDAILTMRPYRGQAARDVENISARSEGGAGGDFAPRTSGGEGAHRCRQFPTVACAALSMPTSTVRSTDSFASHHAKQAKEGNVKVLAIGKRPPLTASPSRRTYWSAITTVYAEPEL